MNSKWFYGVLFILLAALGVKMDSDMLSNQEIVVRFIEDGFSQDKAEQAISEVKSQLQEVGVENIQIRELKDGGLKITYFSDMEVSEIQLVLSGADLCVQDPAKGPLDIPVNDSEQSASFVLNVSEIHANSQSDLDIEGVPVVVNQIKEHLNTLNSVGNIEVFDLSQLYKVNETKLLVSSATARFQSQYFYLLPEVRAGPLA